MKQTLTKITMSCVLLLGVTTPVASTQVTHASTTSLYDFGAKTKEMGYDDALKKASLMKQPLTAWREKPSNANIAMVRRQIGNTNNYSYGTGTAIGKHTILTAAHVVEKEGATKNYQTAPLQKMNVHPQRNGISHPYVYKIKSVDMIKGGDVALVHTKEDLSKVMKVRHLASETSIQKMKTGTPLELNHYSKHAKSIYEKDPEGTIYQSHGQYVMRGLGKGSVSYIRMLSGHGASGGALLNSKGDVTGIVVAGYHSSVAEKAHLKAAYNMTGDIRRQVNQKVY